MPLPITRRAMASLLAGLVPAGRAVAAERRKGIYDYWGVPTAVGVAVIAAVSDLCAGRDGAD